MRKWKALLVTLTIIGMLVSILAACGGAGGSAGRSQPSEAGSSGQGGADQAMPAADDRLKEHLTLKINLWEIDKPSPLDRTKDKVLDKICTDLNIDIEPVNTTWDDYGEKIQVWAASNQLPDCFAIDKFGSSLYYSWVEQGIVKELPDDMSAYPNLTKLLGAKDIQEMKTNGKFYCIPRQTYPDMKMWAGDRTVVIRKDWAEAVGFKEDPKSFDEFIAMLKAFQEKDPDGNGKNDTIGLTAWTLGYLDMLLANLAPGIMNPASIWINVEGTYMPPHYNKELGYKAAKALRTLWDSGVVDKDLPTIKGEEGLDKFAAGKAGALLWSSFPNHQKTVEDKWVKNFPDKKYTDSIRFMKPFPSEDGNNYHVTMPTPWSETYFNGNLDEKKFERLLMLYDYMLDKDKGYTLVRLGFEGTDYKKEGDSLVITRPKDEATGQIKSMADLYPCTYSLSYLAAWSQEFDYENPGFPNQELQKMSREQLDWMMKNTKDIDCIFSPAYVKTENSDLLDSINWYDEFAKIMIGKEDPAAMYDRVYTDAEKKGILKAIDEINAKAKEMGFIK